MFNRYPCAVLSSSLSVLQAVGHGVLCSYPASDCTWIYTQLHFTCDVVPVLPFGSHVPGVTLTAGLIGAPAACHPPHERTAGNASEQCLPVLLKGSWHAWPDLRVAVESIFAVCLETFHWGWWWALSAFSSAQGRGEVHVFLSALGC